MNNRVILGATAPVDGLFAGAVKVNCVSRLGQALIRDSAQKCFVLHY